MLNVSAGRRVALRVLLLMVVIAGAPNIAFASAEAEKRTSRSESSGKRAAGASEDKASDVTYQTATPANAELVIKNALANVNRGTAEILIRTSAWDASAPAASSKSASGAGLSDSEKDRRPSKSRKNTASLGKGSVLWGYSAQNGPDVWGNLSPEFRACRMGGMQSPVDIWSADARFVGDPALAFSYDSVGVRLSDEPIRQLKVLTQAGAVMTAKGVSYYLESIEFRLPGEGRVDGIAPVMNVYLTHRSHDGKYAIVSVPIVVAGEGNSSMDRLWRLVRGEVSHAALDPRRFLPREHDYFHYMGSLTQPPCTEGVAWFVMRDPISISRPQFLAYTRGFSPNARPIQVRDRPVSVSYAP